MLAKKKRKIKREEKRISLVLKKNQLI